MTRREQIENKIKEINLRIPCVYRNNALKEMAEWADENPNGLYNLTDLESELLEKLNKTQNKLEIALKVLKENADTDYRGNRSIESVRSFNALKAIEKLDLV